MQRRVYEKQVMLEVDDELDNNEIKIPENFLEVFIPTHLMYYNKFISFSELKMIESDDRVIKVSRFIYEVLSCYGEKVKVSLVKMEERDSIETNYRICEYKVDSDLESNTIVVPTVITDFGFTPNAICVEPGINKPIEYDTLNIKETKELVAKVSVDVGGKLFCLGNDHLYFYKRDTRL